MSLSDLITAIRALPRDQLPSLMVVIGGIMSEQSAATVDDELIDVAEASRILGLSPSYLYHAKSLPYMVRVGNRRRFSRAGIQRFIAKQAGKA